MTSTTVDADEVAALTGTYVQTVNALVQGDTVMLTNQRTDGADFYITGAGVKLLSASGVVSRPTVNVGKTGPNYTDILNGASLNALNAVGSVIRPSLTGQISLIAPGESLVFRVATAGSATDITLKVSVTGYYA